MDQKEVRSCSCGARMSKIVYDTHSLCSVCTGFACNLTKRCSHCESWTDEKMTNYLRHQTSLIRRRKYKQKIKNEKVNPIESSGPSNVDTATDDLFTDHGENFTSSSMDESDTISISDNIPLQINNTFFETASELEKHVTQSRTEEEEILEDNRDDRLQKRIESMLTNFTSLFDKKIENRMGSIDTKINNIDSKLDNKINNMDRKIDNKLASINSSTNIAPGQSSTHHDESRTADEPETNRDEITHDIASSSNNTSRDLGLVLNTLKVLGFVQDDTERLSRTNISLGLDKSKTPKSPNNDASPAETKARVGGLGTSVKRSFQAAGLTVGDGRPAGKAFKGQVSPTSLRPNIPATGTGTGTRGVPKGQLSTVPPKPHALATATGTVTNKQTHQSDLGLTANTPIGNQSNNNGNRLDNDYYEEIDDDCYDVDENYIEDENFEDDNHQYESGEHIGPGKEEDPHNDNMQGSQVPTLESNTDSTSKDHSFEKLLEEVTRLFPQARPKDSRPPKRTCLHERNYAEVKEKRTFSRLRLYDRIGMIRSEVSEKVSRIMSSGGKPASLLPPRRRTFRVAEEDSFDEPPTLNRETQHLIGSHIPKQEFSLLPSADLNRIEHMLLNLQDNQSFTLWIISSLFDMLHEEGFTSSKPEVLRKMSQVLSSTMVGQSTMTHQLSSYLVAQRRQRIFDTFQPAVLDLQKQRLAATSPFSENLFDPVVLKEVTEEFKGNIATSAQIAYWSKHNSPSIPRRRGMNRAMPGPPHAGIQSQNQYPLPAQPATFTLPPANETATLGNFSNQRSRRSSGRRGRGGSRRRLRLPRTRQGFHS